MKDSATDSEPVTISAVTWNLGNQTASEEAVSAVLNQILPDDTSPPTVVGVATQEELASAGKRLHEQVAEALNKRLNLPEGQRYRVVYVDSHKTYAGFNNMLKDKQFGAFAEIVFTSNNQVSNAVIVKEPYELENPESKIYYESGTSRSNKSIIRVKGKLKKDGEPIMDISIAGTHLDSYKELSRREHLAKFLEGEGLSNKIYDSLDELYEDASQFHIFMGDINERDELRADGSIRNPTEEFALRGFGYDIDRTPHQKVDGKTIHGTYGINMEDGEQVRGTPDAKGRLHCTREGHLDRIACNSGLKVETQRYGGEFTSEHCEFGEKKSYFHGSDHFPVTRNFAVTPPNPEEKVEVVCDYVLRRIPDVAPEIDELANLKQALVDEDREAVFKQIQAMQHYDDNLSPEEYLCQRLDISPTIPFDKMFDEHESRMTVYARLEGEIVQLKGVQETMQKHADELKRIKAKASAKEPISEVEKSNVVKIANIVSQYQESLNHSRTIGAQLEKSRHKAKKTNIFHRLKRHINKKFVKAATLAASFYSTFKAVHTLATGALVFGPLSAINDILNFVSPNVSQKGKQRKLLTTQYMPSSSTQTSPDDDKPNVRARFEAKPTDPAPLKTDEPSSRRSSKKTR